MPGLQWTHVTVPAAGGLDEATAQRVRPPDRLSITNGYFKRNGEVAKRQGFTRLVNSHDDATFEGCKGILSTGEELCKIGKTYLWALHDEAQKWRIRGHVAPAAAKSRRLFREATSYGISDIAYANDFALVVAERQFYGTASTLDVTRGLVATAYAVTDRQVDERKPYTSDGETTTARDQLHSPRCCAVGNTIMGWCLKVCDGTVEELIRYYNFDTTTNTLTKPAASLVTTVAASAVNGDPVRSYDVIPNAAGGYLVAWIEDITGDCIVRRYNAAHAQQATTTISSGANAFRTVALCENSSLSRVYVALELTGGTPQIDVYSRNNSTLAADANASVTFAPSATETLLDGLSATVETDGNHIILAWAPIDAHAEGRRMRCVVDVLNSNLTQVSNAQRSMYGMANRSRPFMHGTRCFVVCGTTSATHVHDNNDIFSVGGTALQTSAYESHVLMEVFFSEPNRSTNDFQPAFCGVWDVGTAVQLEYDRYFQGSANNVVNVSTDKWMTVDNSMVYALASSDDMPLAAVDELELDFAAAVTWTPVHRGCVAISGSFISWYDGQNATELGFVASPFPFGPLTQSNVGGADLVVGEEYQWISAINAYDGKGNLHRSLPSAPVFAEITAGNNTVSLRFLTSHATNRLNIQRATVDVFRANDDSVYKRISEAARFLENRGASNHVTVDFRDTGMAQGPMLYTTGGEIEAVCPEGARALATGLGRLWAGDSVRGDRVQYSKPIAPGTAFEDAIAPEFNEGFGYLVEAGKRVTGLADMDGKMLVFTEASIYYIAGRGPDDAGAANDFSGLVLMTADAGCIEPRSVVGYPGGVFFRSKAGIYAVTRGQGLQFLGDKVRDSLESYPTVTSAVLVPKSSHVRFTCINAAGTDGIILVYDYLHNAWTRWEIKQTGGSAFVPVGACVHKDVYHIVDATGLVMKEDSATWFDDSTQPAVYVPLSITMGWLQPAGPMGWYRVRRFAPLCSWKDSHQLTVGVAYDYSNSIIESQVFTQTQIAAFEDQGAREQPLIHPNRGKCQSFKVTLTDANDSATTGEGFVFDGLTFEIGIKRGAAKVGAETMR